MRHYYRLSPLVWVSTGIAYVTLVGILIYFIYEGLGIEMYLFILAIILLTSITVLWKPVYYEWRPDGLCLRLLAFEKFYSYEDYEIEEDGTMKGRITLRLLGSGGFFGYLGAVLIPYMWVERCNDTDTVFYHIEAYFAIGGNTFDTLGAQGVDSAF